MRLGNQGRAHSSLDNVRWRLIASLYIHPEALSGLSAAPGVWFRPSSWVGRDDPEQRCAKWKRGSAREGARVAVYVQRSPLPEKTDTAEIFRKHVWPQYVNQKVHMAVLRSRSRPEPCVKCPEKCRACISVCTPQWSEARVAAEARRILHSYVVLPAPVCRAILCNIRVPGTSLVAWTGWEGVCLA